MKAEAERCGAMFITERWLGGLLTNFQTVKKQLRRMKSSKQVRKRAADSRTNTKKEQLMLSREREKLGKYLVGIRT